MGSSAQSYYDDLNEERVKKKIGLFLSNYKDTIDILDRIKLNFDNLTNNDLRLTETQWDLVRCIRNDLNKLFNGDM